MDIVAKLRDGAAQAGHYGPWSGGVLMEQAADEIEALRAAIQRRSAYAECAAACDAIAEQYGDGRGGHAALRCANVIRAIASARKVGE